MTGYFTAILILISGGAYWYQHLKARKHKHTVDEQSSQLRTSISSFVDKTYEKPIDTFVNGPEYKIAFTIPFEPPYTIDLINGGRKCVVRHTPGDRRMWPHVISIELLQLIDRQCVIIGRTEYARAFQGETNWEDKMTQEIKSNLDYLIAEANKAQGIVDRV
nr:hypothetical protein [uncultured Arsenicibacter sp.]